MPGAFEIDTFGELLAFLAWTVVIMAIANALFRSFAAAELRWWHERRYHRRNRELSVLGRETLNRLHYDPEVINGNPHAAKRPLTDAEVAERRERLAKLTRGTLGERGLRYFLGCFACQAWWIAILVFALVRGVNDIGDWLASGFAYSGVTVLLGGLMAARSTPTEPQAGGYGGNRAPAR